MKRILSLIFMSAFICILSGQTWEETEKITSFERELNGRFGQAVDICGDYAVVGAYNEDLDENGLNPLSSAGCAYVYYRENGAWMFQQKLVASDRGEDDYFGYDVAIGGDHIVVGAYGEDHFTDFTLNERSRLIDAPHFTAELAPSAGARITAQRRRYVNRPTWHMPWCTNDAKI